MAIDKARESTSDTCTARIPKTVVTAPTSGAMRRKNEIGSIRRSIACQKSMAQAPVNDARMGAILTALFKASPKDKTIFGFSRERLMPTRRSALECTWALTMASLQAEMAIQNGEVGMARRVLDSMRDTPRYAGHALYAR